MSWIYISNWCNEEQQFTDCEDDALDDSTAAEQLKILARRKNLVAMANLTSAMTTKAQYDIGDDN